MRREEAAPEKRLDSFAAGRIDLKFPEHASNVFERLPAVKEVFPGICAFARFMRAAEFPTLKSEGLSVGLTFRPFEWNSAKGKRRA
jgi:hypothetical protein